MKEIEAKILEIDVEKVRQEMEKLGAEKKFEGNVVSEFYDYKDGRIEENGLLRLRATGEHTFITRKTDIEDDRAKVKEEIEFDVSDIDEARKFLTSLGLEKKHDGEKKRAKWHKGPIEYVIDWYPGIPPLLEIEAPNHEQLEQAFKQLGYNPEDTVDWGANKVYQYYGEER